MERCRHEFVKVSSWPSLKDRRYRCRLCKMYTRRYDVVDQMSMRPIHRYMSVAYKPMNVVDLKTGTVPSCLHNVIEVPHVDGDTILFCLKCGERID